MFADLVRQNRSYRRFFENGPISREALLTLVDYARLTPSGSNRQALRYYISGDAATNAKIFPTLLWAMYIKDWDGPVAGERPAGYIVLGQNEGYKAASVADQGIAAQTIMLGAVRMGLGGCMFTNVRREELKEALGLPADFEVLLVLALGKPKETVVVDEMEADGDIKYWRDAEQVHHVPKRRLKDIVLNWE